jgi:hypothetical protein
VSTLFPSRSSTGSGQAAKREKVADADIPSAEQSGQGYSVHPTEMGILVKVHVDPIHLINPDVSFFSYSHTSLSSLSFSFSCCIACGATEEGF